ncbi:MAG: M20/M25/M40 family metallo-hydrolase [Calditrichaeota bacterium]|nr:M20/M25/M40 family metallo-hydrolase [Calditrichota bacterium]
MKLILILALISLKSCGSDTPMESDATQKIVAKVSSDSIFSYIQTLADFGTRRYNYPQKLLARDWLKAKMESFGYMVELEKFPIGADSGFNVIAYKQPITTESYIIFDGHYDSRAEAVSDHSVAPGADDNGSGVAVIMEIARHLATVDTKPIKFIFFDAEEIGLVGSNYHSQAAKNRNDKISFVLNLDMVGGDINNHQQNTIVCEEDQNNKFADDDLSKSLNQELASTMQKYTPLNVVVDAAYASDYEGFEQQGYTIIGLYEYHGQTNLTYHKSIDTFANLHPTFAYDVAKGAMAFMYLKSKVASD